MGPIPVVVVAEQGGVFCPAFERARRRKTDPNEDLETLQRTIESRGELQRAFTSGPWLMCEGDEGDVRLLWSEPETIIDDLLRLGLAVRLDEVKLISMAAIGVIAPEMPMIAVVYLACVTPTPNARWVRSGPRALSERDEPAALAALLAIHDGVTPTSTLEA